MPASRDPNARKLTLVHSSTSAAQPAAAPAAPPPDAPAGKWKLQHKRYPFVRVLYPHPTDKRRGTFRLRMTELGRKRDSPLGHVTEVVAHRQAAEESGRILAARKAQADAKRAGKPPEQPVVDHEIRASALEYYAALGSKSDAARVHFHDTWAYTAPWLRQRGVTMFRQLTVMVLAEWDKWRELTPLQDGSARARSTINQERKYLKAFLRWCAEQPDGRAAHLTDNALRACIKLKKQPKKGTKGVKEIRIYSVPEIRALLLAALAYDHDHPTQQPIAPDVALLLLTGIRVQELVLLRYAMTKINVRSKVDPDNIRESLLALPGEITKGSVARTVYLSGFTDLAIELVQLMREGREGANEYLSSASYSVTRKRISALRSYWVCEKHGASLKRASDCKCENDMPRDIMPKGLRSTCCTYELRLTDKDSQQLLDRQGHTEDVAHAAYWVGQNIPRESTLEKLMRCEPQLRAVLVALQQHQATHEIKRRVKVRKLPNRAKAELD